MKLKCKERREKKVKSLRAPYIIPKQLACELELREDIEAHEPSDSLSKASCVRKDKVEVR